MEMIIEKLAAYGLLIVLVLILTFILKEIIKAWIWSIMLKKVAKYQSKQIAIEIKKTEIEK